MPNSLTDVERAANFVYDLETDCAVRPIRSGMRLVRAIRPDGVRQYRIESWGRLPSDLDGEPDRWITTHAGPEQINSESAIRWAQTAADKPPERQFQASSVPTGIHPDIMQ